MEPCFGMTSFNMSESDLHKEADIILGGELNCLSCKDLKRYSLPKDKSNFV